VKDLPTHSLKSISFISLTSAFTIWPLVPQQLPEFVWGSAAPPGFWMEPQQVACSTSTAAAAFGSPELQQDEFDISLYFSTFLVSSLYILRSFCLSIIVMSVHQNEGSMLENLEREFKIEHTNKASIPQPFLVLHDKASTTYTTNVQRHISLEIWWKFFFGEDIADSGPPTGLQQAENFFENKMLVFRWDKVDNAIADNTVCATRR
jgi:hypothetical protein